MKETPYRVSSPDGTVLARFALASLRAAITRRRLSLHWMMRRHLWHIGAREARLAEVSRAHHEVHRAVLVQDGVGVQPVQLAVHAQLAVVFQRQRAEARDVHLVKGLGYDVGQRQADADLEVVTAGETASEANARVS